jgi:nucleoside-diphosphate-sugar epimerase
MRGDRVVILGSAGFVAPALAASLRSDGIDFVAIGSSTLDLSDPMSGPRLAQMLHRDDTLVFAAALTPEKGRDLATLAKNLRMAEAVSGALSITPVKHLVYFSSDAVYGEASQPLNESSPAAPIDLYGIMHRSREIAVADAAQKSAFPLCVLRPSAIYGSGDTHNGYGPNRFIRSALKEQKIQIFGLGEERRDHVYIDDVVSLTRQVISNRSAGVLNLVSGQAVSFGDLAHLIANLTGGATKIESVPRKTAVSHRTFDATAINERFSSHTPTPLQTGLTKMIEILSHG